MAASLQHKVDNQPLATFWDLPFSHSDASISRKSCLVTILGSCLSLGKLEQDFWKRDALPHSSQLGLGRRRWNLEDLFSGSWISASVPYQTVEKLTHICVTSSKSSRLLQLAAVRHLQVKSQQTTASAEWSCASRAPSCLEIQLGALAQTASLAPGSAKDHIQDGAYYIQREILQSAFLSLQSPGQLHAITEPEVWGTTSSSDSSSEVCGSQTQLLFWRANRLEQSQFENPRSRLTRVIQDTSKDRTV